MGLRYVCGCACVHKNSYTCIHRMIVYIIPCPSNNFFSSLRIVIEGQGLMGLRYVCVGVRVYIQIRILVHTHTHTHTHTRTHTHTHTHTRVHSACMKEQGTMGARELCVWSGDGQ